MCVPMVAHPSLAVLVLLVSQASLPVCTIDVVFAVLSFLIGLVWLIIIFQGHRLEACVTLSQSRSNHQKNQLPIICQLATVGTSVDEA